MPGSFPRWRVASLAYFGAERLLGRLVVLLLAATIAACLAVPTADALVGHHSLAIKLLVSAGFGLAGLAVVALVLFFAVLIRYRLRGDIVWKPTARRDGGSIRFLLSSEPRPGLPRVPSSRLGVVEARVRLPSGEIRALHDEDVQGLGEDTLVSVAVPLPVTADLCEIRWYATFGERRQFQEVARLTVMADRLDD